MHYIVVALVFCQTIFFSHVSWADEQEIQYLLTTISTSECTFQRNGKQYPGPKAFSHLQRKYSHVKKRIHTTEDFIDKVATKSSISGRKYEMNCAGTSQPTGRWLYEILSDHREEK